jgi:hypothetical protein
MHLTFDKDLFVFYKTKLALYSIRKHICLHISWKIMFPPGLLLFCEAIISLFLQWSHNLFPKTIALKCSF